MKLMKRTGQTIIRQNYKHRNLKNFVSDNQILPKKYRIKYAHGPFQKMKLQLSKKKLFLKNISSSWITWEKNMNYSWKVNQKSGIWKGSIWWKNITWRCCVWKKVLILPIIKFLDRWRHFFHNSNNCQFLPLIFFHFWNNNCRYYSQKWFLFMNSSRTTVFEYLHNY